MLNQRLKSPSTFYRVTASIASQTFAFVPHELVEVPGTAPAEVRQLFERLSTGSSDREPIMVSTEPLPSYVQRTVISPGFRVSEPPPPPPRAWLSRGDVCALLGVGSDELDALQALSNFPPPRTTRTYHVGQDQPEVVERWNPEHVERWREQQGGLRHILMGLHHA